MKRGHLQRRGCVGRAVAWCRLPMIRDGHMIGVEYRIFRRLSVSGKTVMQSHAFLLGVLSSSRYPRLAIANQLRAMRAQLKWQADRLDFEAMGMVDTTPEPETTHRPGVYPVRWPA